MPNIVSSTYRPSFFKRNGHFQSIYPSLFRKINFIEPVRQRLTTSDQDFIDVDWYEQNSKNLVIITHGLEGNSTRAYIRGMAKLFFTSGFDVCAWNLRSCSGEINKTPRFYHSGDIEDISLLIQSALEKNKYENISLLGFSLGGNIVLNYVGRLANKIPNQIKSAVAISVPVDVQSSSVRLSMWQNKIYMVRFLRMLGKKIKIKSKLFPDVISSDGFDKIKNFKQFDDRYTSKLHGFVDAEDFWKKVSSLPYLSNITVPTLLINAKDDPFLSDKCFPYQIADNSLYFYLETPDSGGHCGFVSRSEFYWSERRSLEFIQSHL